ETARDEAVLAAADAVAVVAAGLGVESVSGAVSLPVTHGWTYELHATAAASVTLNAPLGSQVAIIWTGTTGALEGRPVADGEAWAAVRLTAGWSLFPVNLAPPDTTPPTPGAIAGSAITSTGFTLTISGASDAGGLHATPYAFSTDNGSTWSAYQAGAS